MKTLLGKVFNYETISYFIVGVLTTVVDYLVFIVVNEALKRAGITGSAAAVTATVISWVAAVLFAFITNKLIVFKSMSFSPSVLAKEGSTFLGARAASGVITVILMWVMTGPLKWNEYIAKVLTSVFNLVFNYVASKFFIFKK